MAKDKNNHEIDLSKYKDPSGLSVKEMNFGLWLSENRKRITKITIIFLIALSAFFFVYSSYNYVIYFLNSSAEEAGVASLVNSTVTSQRNVALDITVKTPQIFKNGETYDLTANIFNPNEKFAATFKYCFVIEKTDINCGDGFILPKEEKYIFALGQNINSDSPAVNFEIRSVSWQRIDTRTIPDWDSFAGSHLNFSLKGIKFTPAAVSGVSGTSNLSSLEFTITNLTNYGYYEVPLNISFYKGSELVGVNYFIAKDFLAGEDRFVRLNWVSNIPQSVRVEIRPNLNLLDDSIYLKYQGVK